MTDPEVNLNTFTQQEREDSAALKPIRTGDSPRPQPDCHSPPTQMTPWGQIGEAPTPARGRGAEALGRTQQCGEAEGEGRRESVGATDLHQKHLHCRSVSPPDGLIFGSLQHIRFAGDPTQVRDLEEAWFSECLPTKSFLCWNSCQLC